MCRFCSDVVSVNGRTFRSRSLENVLAELAHHRARYRVSQFCFSDLKLNSDLGLWRGLLEELPAVVPDARWTCAVHVGPRADEGLTPADLRAARRAGLVRVTTGLETGSDRLADEMQKGTRVDRTAEFLRAARAAGISTRVTAFTGYPGETPEDLERTADFLNGNADFIGRVHLSRLLVQSGTPLKEQLRRADRSAGGLELDSSVPEEALVRHVDPSARSPATRRAVARVLRAAHAINRRPLVDDARELEGAM